MSSPGEFWASLPPISKIFASTCFATTCAFQFGLLDARSIILDWGLVIYKFQPWRLVSNFVFIGGFGFPFIFRLLMILQYGVQLEKHTFEGRTADFLFMMMFGAGVMLGISILIPQLNLIVMASPLIFMLLYVWSRENPTNSVSIYGLIKLQAFYLPWAFLAITMLMGGNPIPDLIGILVGHLYYFIVVLQPRAIGRDLIHTPGKTFTSWAGLGAPDPAYVAARTQGYQPFRGQGRRMNE